MADGKNSFAELIQVEEFHYAAGRLPLHQKGFSSFYHSLAVDYNFRSAEVHLAQLQYSSHLYLKTLLWRGQAHRAKLVLKEMDGSSVSEAEAAELELQRAKMHGQAGEWQTCLDTIEPILARSVSLISRLTLYQMKAFSLFELGDFRGALEALENSDSLESIFKTSPSSLYCKLLRIKILTRTAKPEFVRSQLDLLWREAIAEQSIHADFLLSILRGELDFARIQGKPIHKLALGCLCLSQKMGDALYRGFALLDLRQVANDTHSSSLDSLLGELTLHYPRIARGLSSLQGRNQSDFFIDQTSRAYQMRLPTVSNEEFDFIPEKTDFIYFEAWDILYSLKTNQVSLLSSKVRVSHALKATKTGECEKSRFFKKIWGNQKYTPRLHDPVIWKLCHKVRKDLGVKLVTDDGYVKSQGILFL